LTARDGVPPSLDDQRQHRRQGCRIWNNGAGAPASTIIMGNDFSGTDTAYNNVTPGIGNLP
jgi:hypothetical protein